MYIFKENLRGLGQKIWKKCILLWTSHKCFYLGFVLFCIELYRDTPRAFKLTFNTYVTFEMRKRHIVEWGNMYSSPDESVIRFIKCL